MVLEGCGREILLSLRKFLAKWPCYWVAVNIPAIRCSKHYRHEASEAFVRQNQLVKMYVTRHSVRIRVTSRSKHPNFQQ